ncbi:conserved hypothetical protein [Cupriavidus oxalaticus]|uniref:Uncharacterized protein n=2 Tax=Cupriavidus TaxID=106589 RepID=A0A375GKR4_9BURK|nr:conserved hypothetical protein [Cupriavidus oxalaticus]
MPCGRADRPAGTAGTAGAAGRRAEAARRCRGRRRCARGVPHQPGLSPRAVRADRQCRAAAGHRRLCAPHPPDPLRHAGGRGLPRARAAGALGHDRGVAAGRPRGAGRPVPPPPAAVARCLSRRGAGPGRCLNGSGRASPPPPRGSGITAKSEPAYAAVRHRPIPCARDAAYIGSSVTTARSRFMSFALYIIGLLVLVGGIAWAMSTAGLATVYIGIACLIVLGIGIMMAVSRTRTKDPS